MRALNPLFRREWSSVYEALQDCRPDRDKLMQLYIQQLSQVERPVLAIDMPSLAEIWQLYLRRFALEHWYRLAKQTLHWTARRSSALLNSALDGAI